MPGVTTAYQNGIHSARPAAGSGCILYACSTHSLIYRSDGTTWTTWMTIGTTTTSVATDPIWDAAGDLVQGTGADTGAKLSAGTLGQFLMSGGAAAANSWASHQLDYVESTTADTAVTATTEAGATTIVTGNAVAYDGSTPVLIEFYAPMILLPSVAGDDFTIVLYDGGSSIGKLSVALTPANSLGYPGALNVSRRLTPSNASHTYSIRAYGSRNDGHIYAGAGGSGNRMPLYIRITRAA